MKRSLLQLLATVALPTPVKSDNAFDSMVDKSDNTDF